MLVARYVTRKCDISRDIAYKVNEIYKMGKLHSGTNVEINSFPLLSLSLSLNTGVLRYEIDLIVEK